MSKFIFLVPIFAFLLAQGIKTLTYYRFHKKFLAERLWGAGGMPSSHSAGVCSLVTVIGRIDGCDSTIFAVALVFALIVMYDAAGVRRAAGYNAKAINEIRLERDIEQGDLEGVKPAGKKLKESLGHTPLQVLCGAVMGIVIGLLVPDKWL